MSGKQIIISLIIVIISFNSIIESSEPKRRKITEEEVLVPAPVPEQFPFHELPSELQEVTLLERVIQIIHENDSLEQAIHQINGLKLLSKRWYAFLSNAANSEKIIKMASQKFNVSYQLVALFYFGPTQGMQWIEDKNKALFAAQERVLENIIIDNMLIEATKLFSGSPLTRKILNTLIENGGSYDIGLARQSNGKIIYANRVSYQNNEIFVLRRLNANGTRDTSFNITFPPNIDAIKNVIVLPDNKVFVISFLQNQSNIHKLNEDGTIDRDFGTNGTIGVAQSAIESLALLPDNRIVMCGLRQNRNIMSIYSPSGQLLKNFDIHHTRTRFSAIAIDSDGSIVIFGAQYVPGQFVHKPIIKRYSLVDNTLNLLQTFTTQNQDGALHPQILNIQPNKNIVTAGTNQDMDQDIKVFTVTLYNPGGNQQAQFAMEITEEESSESEEPGEDDEPVQPDQD